MRGGVVHTGEGRSRTHRGGAESYTQVRGGVVHTGEGRSHTQARGGVIQVRGGVTHR